jgi:hypothetical protein
MVISANTTGFITLDLQATTVPVSAYYIWRQLKALALTIHSSVSENLASQSIDILKHIAADPGLYEYFYENKPFQKGDSSRTYVLCSAEMPGDRSDRSISFAEFRHGACRPEVMASLGQCSKKRAGRQV